MKRTIAAILVTILASAGYIVLDKASVEKINTLESQVSAQQAVIDNLGAAADPLEMWTGCTLRCYPSEGATLIALVRETSWIYPFSDDTTHGTTTTTAVHVQPEEPTATTAPTATTTVVHAQWDEEPTTPTTIPSTTVPYYYEREGVKITEFRCTMIGKTPTGIPRFSVNLSGKVDPALAGRWVDVYFGDATANIGSAGGSILYDGSFSVSTEVVLANSTVIPLYEIFIY